MRKRRWVWALPVALAAGAGGFAYWRTLPPDLPPPPSEARLAALRAARDKLEERLRVAVAAHGEKSVAHAPRAGVMIGIPVGFTRSILQQVVTGVFGQTTLTLRNLKVHKEGQVKAKMLLRKKKIGEYVLDVDIHEVQGILKPGEPTLRFDRNRVFVDLPVHLAEGSGNAELRFRWDSKGLAANVVCGDVDLTRTVTGGVVPHDYLLSGSFAVSSAGDVVTLRPDFPELAVRIFVDPSEQAWEVVDGVVRDRPRGCEIALNKVDIKEKLSGILARGFNVKIPQKIFKPIRLPAGISRALEIQGIQLALDVKPTGVLVASDRLWYGADLILGPKKALPVPSDRR